MRALVRVAGASASFAIWLTGCSHSKPTVSPLEQGLIEAALSQCTFIHPSNRDHILYHETSVQTLWLGESSYEQFGNKLRKEAAYKRRDVREAVEDFVVKNRSDIELVFPRRLPRNTHLLTASVGKNLASAMTSKNDLTNLTLRYDAFRRRFPNATQLIMISRPGFDSQATTALLCVSVRADIRGGGAILIFRRVDGKWLIQDSDLDLEHSWIS
jgi:hypothetical protein